MYFDYETINQFKLLHKIFLQSSDNFVDQYDKMYLDTVLKHWYNQKPRGIHQKRGRDTKKSPRKSLVRLLTWGDLLVIRQQSVQGVIVMNLQILIDEKY